MDLFYYFLGAGIILFILEMLTPSTFIFFSFGVSCIITSIITFFLKDIPELIIIMSCLTILVYLILRRGNFFQPAKDYKSNADMYLEKEAQVIQKLEKGKYRVKIFEEEWTCYSEEEFEIGDKVKINKVEGAHFLVSKN